jgi:hypothetical protein
MRDEELSCTGKRKLVNGLADRPGSCPLIGAYMVRNPPAACRRPKGRFGQQSGRPSAFPDPTMTRTIVYIDGFNL